MRKRRFHSLYFRAQRYLMKSNGSVGMELMTAAFFFAHDAKTLLEQVCLVYANLYS